VSPKKRSGVRVDASYAAAHPDADPAATELVINLLSAANLVAGRLDAVLRSKGLAVGSFNVLTIVAGAGEPLGPSTIAERMPVPVALPTLTGLLDTLQRRGYLGRAPHPGDRRRVLVELTAAGRRALDEVAPLVAAEERRIVEGLSATAKAATTDRLGDLYDQLRS
jgi:DNA-binding MarR family transcriptional regulator